MKTYKTIIWDWNGTLADDLMASLRATNDTLARRNMPPLDVPTYHSYIDSPISRFYEHLFDLNVVPMEVLGQEFQEGYAKYFDSLHVGARELLAELHAAGIRQVILTASHRDLVEQDLLRFGIREYFDEIIGAEDILAAGKTERGLRWRACQTCQAGDMVMVGDTLHDYDTAKAMGVDCILCAIGHQSKADLLTTGTRVVDKFTDLRELLLPAA